MACVEEPPEACRPFSPKPPNHVPWQATAPGSPAKKTMAYDSITHNNSTAAVPSSGSGAWLVDMSPATATASPRGHSTMSLRHRASLDNYPSPPSNSARTQRASLDMGSMRASNGPVTVTSGPFASGSNAGFSKSGKLQSRRGSLEALQSERSKGQLSQASPSGRLRSRVSFADNAGKNLLVAAEELEHYYSPNKDGKRLAMEPISQIFKDGLTSPQASFSAVKVTSGSLSTFIPPASNPTSGLSATCSPSPLSNSTLVAPRTPSARSMHRPDIDVMASQAPEDATDSQALPPVQAKPAKMTERLLARFRALL